MPSAKLAMPKLPRLQIRYATKQTVSGNYNTVQPVTLNRTQGVLSYRLSTSLGTLSGGTTPAYAPSQSAPVVTHVQVVADNTIIFDCDMGNWEEWQKLITHGGITPDGKNFHIDMCDTHIKRGEFFESTLLASWKFNQLTMNVTYNTLANITTGSPTSDSGTTLLITELCVPRSAVTFTPHLVKKIGFSTSLTTQAAPNALTTFLSQTGAYKALLLFATSSNSAPYANGSDTIFDYMTLKLNDLITDKDAWFTNIKEDNKVLFRVAPDTGYAAFVWMEDDELTKLLNLANTRQVTAVNLTVDNTQNATEYLYAIKIEYV